jgi:hypothetical protein
MISNIIAVIALILSGFTFGIAQRFARVSDRRARMPVLVFIYENKRWLLRNVGNGPALNIDMAIKYDHGDRNWVAPTRIPPIGREEQFHLSWLGDLSVAVLAASYEDFLHTATSRKSGEYTVQSHHDLNQVVPARELPRWKVNETMPAWERVKQPLKWGDR